MFGRRTFYIYDSYTRVGVSGCQVRDLTLQFQEPVPVGLTVTVTMLLYIVLIIILSYSIALFLYVPVAMANCVLSVEVRLLYCPW